MMNKPIISVIIPLYNKEKIVERSVRSVLNQRFTDFELIVVDDGSTDHSADVVRRIKDDRIVFIQQENGGPSKARNAGVRHARGEWVLFIDADDEMLPDALEHFSNAINKYPQADMILGEVYIQNNGEKYLAKRYPNGEVCNIFKAHVNNLLLQCSGSSIYKKELVDEYPYNEYIRRYEDLETLYRKYKSSTLYTIDVPTACINVDFADASKGRDDISEDFVGHIDISNKGFWEKLAYYKLFFEEHVLYKEQTHKLYPHLYRRYDLYILCMLINKISNNKFLQIFFLLIIGNPIKQVK